jgi:two-component system response regulator PhoP
LPILILTARGGWKAKVEGLESGADDYMEKPFHIEELVARSRALLRRITGHSTQLNLGPIKLDIESQQVTLSGQAIELTAFEYKILEYMMRRPNEVISKTRLTEYLYDQDFDRDSNVVEVLVARLRKKFAVKDGFNPIVTLRGRGYQFNVIP